MAAIRFFMNLWRSTNAKLLWIQFLLQTGLRTGSETITEKRSNETGAQNVVWTSRHLNYFAAFLVTFLSSFPELILRQTLRLSCVS